MGEEDEEGAEAKPLPYELADGNGESYMQNPTGIVR